MSDIEPTPKSYYAAIRYEPGQFSMEHILCLIRMMRQHIEDGDITLLSEVHIWHNQTERMVALVVGDLVQDDDDWEKLL